MKKCVPYLLMALITSTAQADQDESDLPPGPPPIQSQLQQAPQIPTELPKGTQLNIAQLTASCARDSRVMAMNTLRLKQNQFVNVNPDRINQFLKRAAAVVKNRYTEIAQPATRLGRLVTQPFCGGAAGGGMLAAGALGENVRVSDTSQFPDFQNCLFVFESEAQPAGSPIQLARVTELAADIHVDLTFDDKATALTPSALRQAGTPAPRFEVELLSEPYVLEARPNIPPPVSFAQKPGTPTWAPDTDIGNLGDLKDLGVENTLQNRLALANRAVSARETGTFLPSSLKEQIILPNAAIDPCGETQRFSSFLAGLLNVFEEHCYTYASTLPTLGEVRSDPRFLGQLRLLFQKDARTQKIIGIRAFSFGGNI